VPELIDTAEQAVGHAKPAEMVEAFAVRRVATTIQADHRGGVRSLEHSEVRGLGVRLVVGQRLGYASTSDLSASAVKDVVRKARQNADGADIDEAQMLPRPSTAPPAPDLAQSRWDDATLLDKVSFITEVARRVVLADPLVRSIDTCELRDERSTTAIVSTTGVATVDDRAFVGAWCEAIGDDHSERAADVGYLFARCLPDLDADRLVDRTVKRTSRLLGNAAAPGPGLPIILDPVVVAHLFDAVGRALAGGPMSSGRSPFADGVGGAVAAPAVTLVDCGRAVSSPSGSRYDDEGVPRRDTVVIRDGVLTGALHSTVTAAAIGGGATSTGNARRLSYRSPPRAGPSALTLRPTLTHDELVTRFPDAVYIQQLSGSGSGINAVTGGVDVGGSGWIWRDGQPAGRFSDLALSTDLRRLLTSVIGVADDVDYVPWTSVLASTMVLGSEVFAHAS